PALAGSDAASYSVDLAGDHYMGFQVPLRSSSGEGVGSVLGMRSGSEEMASFVKFRTSLILVGVVVMLLGMVGAYVVASRITDPVRQLVGLVERARDGSYSGAVAVATNDEIG